MGLDQDLNDINLKLAADLDRAMAGLRDVARLSRTYYKALREEGFTEPRAVQMVMEWQRLAFTSALRPPDQRDKP